MRRLSDTTPDKIGRYRVTREVGRGAMGVVYEAEDPVLGRRVAIKTISLDLAPLRSDGAGSYQRRFLVEARAAASLSHPGIVVVYDVGQDGASGQLYIALEYLVGETLDRRLAREGPADWRWALDTTVQLARALVHAHSRQVIHRDIKPSNVMVVESGEVKLLDFGIAKLPTSQLTAGGEAFGSPSYMSPEAALEESLDSRSDIFSLGVVLYELLTGERAFDGNSIPAILTRVAYDDPPPPSHKNATLPPELDLVLARALAKHAGDRYQSASELAEDLEDVLARRSPRHVAERRPPRRGRRTLVTSMDELGAQLAHGASRVDPSDTQRSSIGLALPQGKRVSLAILEGPSQGAVHLVERPRLVIGRSGGDSGAQLEIPDPEISRAHAVVEFYGTRILLRDLESTNGTFVGEQRIRDHELQHQSEFRAGKTRFMLVLTDLDPS